MTMKQGRSENQDLRKVYIVDGARTPFLRVKNKPLEFAASDLAVYAARELLMRNNIAADIIDEVVVGCMMPSEKEANIARVIALRLGCGHAVPAWTVQRNCGSGLQAIDEAMKDIAIGRADLILTGGTEAMSRAPLLFNSEAVSWFADLSIAKTPLNKINQLLKFRPRFLSPVISLMHGLTDPVINLGMGQTAQELAFDFNIRREEMDAYAMQSNLRAAEARRTGKLAEAITIYGKSGTAYEFDDGIRDDSAMDKLAKLKPVFEKFGDITAGNSSQITDGAAMLLLASAEAVKKYKLPVIGVIRDINWSGLNPAKMGLGPAFAIPPLLARNNLSLEDMDCIELNEAFAAQVIGCLRAWESKDFCQKELNLPDAFGSLDINKLNIDGGAIALGHPVSASGARVALHVLKILQRDNKKIGVASMCIGGGQGGAILLERVSEVE